MLHTKFELIGNEIKILATLSYELHNEDSCCLYDDPHFRNDDQVQWKKNLILIQLINHVDI